LCLWSSLIMAITSNVAATILILSFVAPAMAQSAFPNFDYQCEKFARPPFNAEVWGTRNPKIDDITMLVNDCLDKEASARKSAEYKWELASENVRAESMTQLAYTTRYSGDRAACPFYRYLDGILSDFSELEANKRLSEKRPGVHY
jgi:hypothetical protein